jgi:hypothetical protein
MQFVKFPLYQQMLHRFPDTLYHICVFLSFSHNLFVKNAESDTNGTIWSQGTDANAVTPLRGKLQEGSLLSIAPIQKVICLI